MCWECVSALPMTMPVTSRVSSMDSWHGGVPAEDAVKQARYKLSRGNQALFPAWAASFRSSARRRWTVGEVGRDERDMLSNEQGKVHLLRDGLPTAVANLKLLTCRVGVCSYPPMTGLCSHSPNRIEKEVRSAHAVWEIGWNLSGLARLYIIVVIY